MACHTSAACALLIRSDLQSGVQGGSYRKPESRGGTVGVQVGDLHTAIHPPARVGTGFPGTRPVRLIVWEEVIMVMTIMIIAS